MHYKRAFTIINDLLRVISFIPNVVFIVGTNNSLKVYYIFMYSSMYIVIV